MSKLLQAIPDLQTLIIRMRMLESLKNHYLNVNYDRIPDPNNVLQGRRICQDLLREIVTLQEKFTNKQIQDSCHEYVLFQLLNLNPLEPRDELDVLISGVQMQQSLSLLRRQKDQQVQVNQTEDSIWPKLKFRWSCCLCCIFGCSNWKK